MWITRSEQPPEEEESPLLKAWDVLCGQLDSFLAEDPKTLPVTEIAFFEDYREKYPEYELDFVGGCVRLEGAFLPSKYFPCEEFINAHITFEEVVKLSIEKTPVISEVPKHVMHNLYEIFIYSASERTTLLSSMEKFFHE